MEIHRFQDGEMVEIVEMRLEDAQAVVVKPMVVRGNKG